MTEKKEFNITIEGPKHHGGVHMGLAIAKQLRESLPGVTVNYCDNENSDTAVQLYQETPIISPDLAKLLADKDVTINIKVTV